MGKSKKNSKQSHNFIFIVCIISLAVIFVICYKSLKNESKKKDAELSRMQSVYDGIIVENEELQRKKDKGEDIENYKNSSSSADENQEYSTEVSESESETSENENDEYMEKVARENGYIKPGDRVYQDVAAGE